MKVAYSTKALLGSEFIDSVINYSDFKYIIQSGIHGNYGHFVLTTEQKDNSLLKRFSELFSKKTVPFNEAIIHDISHFYEDYGFYFPDQILFYDKYPQGENDTDIYSIVSINEKIELRHSLKGYKEIKDFPKAHEQVTDKKSIEKLQESFKILLPKVRAAKEKRDTENASKRALILSKVNFDKPIKTFLELGYLSSDITATKPIVDEIINDEFLYEDDIDKLARKNLCKMFYLKISHTDNQGNYLTNKCILCDHEFLDPSEEYISFLHQFGVITKGELSFSDATLSIDKDGYEQLDFKVNGVSKTWRLQKPGFIASDFFNRFALLTKEFNTKGKFTYYSDGGQAFVVDYATEEEQELFTKKTRIKRKWLE